MLKSTNKGCSSLLDGFPCRFGPVDDTCASSCTGPGGSCSLMLHVNIVT
jgi:hypothetical protein